jgi:hypothetical protein
MTREDPAAFAPPPAFGPFRVLHQIGVGALGPVFRTYEPTRDRLIAVKVFRLDITPEQAQTLADELAKSADAGLFHPSIVEPVAAGLQGTVAYRAEEYVAAESLDVAIRHYAPAPMEKALPFITQLAGAIDFARAAGIGHGALHLRDIFVTPEEARASGFGVVEALERTGLRAPIRRPYAAPERIAGDTWGTPADVFSLAAISYELLTGRRPAGIGAEIAPLGPSEGGPNAPAVSAVLARAMEADPSARYQTALAFASALEAAASGEGEHVPLAAAAPPHNEIALPAEADTRFAEADLMAGGIEPGHEPPLDADDDIDYREAALDEPVEEPRALDRDDEVAAENDDLAFGRPAASVERPAPADDMLRSAAAASLLDLDDDASGESFRQPADGSAVVSDAAGAPEFREAAAVGPPRTAMFPIAVGLVLGLLIGFAAAYAIFGSTSEPAPANQSGGAPPSEPAATAGVVASDTEQPVGPSSTPGSSPPVPNDVPAPEPVLPTSGTIVIESSPARAAVTVNKEWAGRTPLTLEDQPFGRYDIRVVQDGYAVATETVRLSPEDPTRKLSLRLEREDPQPARPAPRAQPPPRQAPPPARPAEPRTFLGSMFVDSRPQGARVTVNGKPVGTTPLRLSGLAIGSHVVRLELPDHRIWSISARVQAGQETRVSGSLEPIR